MAFLRFTVGSSQKTRTLRGAIAACWLVVMGSTSPAPAASPLQPGAHPCVTNAIPDGFGTLTLVGSATFSQSGDSVPTEVAAPPPTFVTEVVSPSAFVISNALAANPRGFSLAVPYQGSGISSASTNFPTEAALLNAFSPGTWNASFQLVFPSGDSFVGFSVFNVSSNSAPIPQVANYAEAQQVSSSADFPLNWIPWVGSATNDRISLVIVDAAGNTLVSAATDCSGQSTLAAGATGFTIPAGRLAPASTYTGYLTFGASRLHDQDAGALLVQNAFLSRTTQFPIRTATSGGSGSPGTLSNPVLTESALLMTLTGTPGTIYSVQASPDLATWNEQTRVTLPPSGTSQVTLPLPPPNAPRFYRAVAVGGGTNPGTGATLSISILSLNPTRLRVTVTGTPGSTHTVESTTNWVAWSEVGTVVIPENASNVVFTASAPAGSLFGVYRARAGEVVTPPPPTGKRPTLAAAVAPTGLRILVSGGDPNRAYAVQQANATFTSWSATPLTITTGADGSGEGTLSPLANPSAVLRVEAR
ncbi:MAG: hypothetical protein AB7J34_07585 [Limisphaerales bacterium]